MFKSQKFFAGWFLVCAFLFSNQAAFAIDLHLQIDKFFLGFVDIKSLKATNLIALGESRRSAEKDGPSLKGTNNYGLMFVPFRDGRARTNYVGILPTLLNLSLSATKNFKNSNLADKFFRTELYFGTDIAGGGKVSEEDWNKFLETEVTPRFPDGFTVLEGYGQYKDSSGKIVREANKILIIFYPKKSREATGTKIDEIREKYKKQFNQESVLRLDFLKPVNVSF